MPNDYYDVLGVPRTASQAEIKKAFRQVARELHPDVNKHDPQAEEKFKEAAEAYEVLTDSQRRAIYDRYGHQGLRSGGFEPSFAHFGDLSQIFETFFGSADPFASVFGGRRGGPPRGEDVAVELEVSLEEVAHGAVKEVEFESLVPCSRCAGSGAEPGSAVVTCTRCEGSGQLTTVSQTVFGQMMRSATCDRCNGEGAIPEERCSACHGRGVVADTRAFSVEIPPGIESGQRIRLTGKGGAGARGGQSGNLYVLVSVAPDPRFERHGDELVTTVDVPFTDAALGGAVTVPTLEGETELELKAGTQPGTIVHLRGKGLPGLGRRKRGDLHVLVNVMVPQNLSEEQRDLLERFAQASNGANYPAGGERPGVFDRLRQAFRG
jgi:molecular chaperone DnaJ